jgi:hypothetical protein
MTNRNVQLGILPTNGPVITGEILQTARVDLPGAYDAVNGTVVGDSIRFGPYRLYSSFSDVMDGSAFAANSPETMVHNAGHTVILSWGQGGYSGSDYKKAHPNDSWWAAVAAGYADTQLKNMFAKVHGLEFGTAVVPVPTTSGKKLPIPGSTKKGSKPTEVILAPVSHEPNIPETHFGTAAEFAAAMKHCMVLYDTWRGAQTPAITVKRIAFTVIISNPGGKVTSTCSDYYGIGTANDISGTGSRPVDKPGWDIYYPQVEKGNGPASPGPGSGGNGNSVYFGSKFQQLNDWVYATGAGKGHFSNTTRQVIGEIGCRIQTAKSGDGTAPDSGWADKFWNNATSGFTKWNQNNALPNGDHPLHYVCLFASGGLMLQDAKHGYGASGNIDNSIIPDTTTYDATFQNGGFSVRPQFVAVRACLVANGNETMGASVTASVPSAPTFDTPTAGQTSTVLHFTVPDDSVNIVKDGVVTQSNKTGTSATIYADGTKPFPQDAVYGLTGNKGTDTSAESATVTVHWLASTVSPPAAAGKPVVSNVGQASATFTVTPVATATLYSWYLDSNTTVGSPDFTSPTPVIAASGLTPGSHTVKCLPSNAGGYPSVSGTPTFSTASNSFTMTSSPDTHAPPTPATPTLADMGSDGATPTITWAAVTDTVTAGETTSGMREYSILRSLTNLPETAVEISVVPASLTTFTDDKAPQSTQGPTDVYYFVAARDNVLLTSPPSTPVKATIPASTSAADPVAVLTLPALVNVGALFTADATASTPGTGGAITAYTFDFEDGTEDDPANLTNPLRRHTYSEFRQYLVTLTVTDASGNKSAPVQQYIIAQPSDGLTFEETGAPKVIPGAPQLADDVNKPLKVHDDSIGTLRDRLDGHDQILTQIGDPLTPRRHGGALFATINPESVNNQYDLGAGVMHVMRCQTLDQEPFASVNWVQVNATVTAASVTNAFWAVYDVGGNLISATTATDCSADCMVQDEHTYVFDGGPFDLPLGVDVGDDPQQPPTNEFFIAFYLGTVGASKPQIAVGSKFANAVNIGTSKTAVTPTRDTIHSVPLFSTAANTPGSALHPPATLGALTRLGASMLAVIYP